MLNALREKAATYPNFQLLFGVTVRDVTREGEKIVGVMATRRAEQFEVRARVTVGADGRASAVRKTAEFKMEYEDYDFDVAWFTARRHEHFENTVRAFFTPQRTYLVLPKYPDLVQCGILVGKGEFSQIREQGIEAMKQELLNAHPMLHDFARQLTDFEPFGVLQARVSYVARWAKEGCLLIGDAAHTCSPAGAIGVSRGGRDRHRRGGCDHQGVQARRPFFCHIKQSPDYTRFRRPAYSDHAGLFHHRGVLEVPSSAAAGVVKHFHPGARRDPAKILSPDRRDG